MSPLLLKDFTGTKILCQRCQDADQTERLDPSKPSTNQQQGSDPERVRKKLVIELQNAVFTRPTAIHLHP